MSECPLWLACFFMQARVVLLARSLLILRSQKSGLGHGAWYTAFPGWVGAGMVCGFESLCPNVDFCLGFFGWLGGWNSIWINVQARDAFEQRFGPPDTSAPAFIYLIYGRLIRAGQAERNSDKVYGTPPLQVPVFEFAEVVRGSTPRVRMQMWAKTRFGMFWDKLLFPQSSTLPPHSAPDAFSFTSLNPCCAGGNQGNANPRASFQVDPGHNQHQRSCRKVGIFCWVADAGGKNGGPKTFNVPQARTKISIFRREFCDRSRLGDIGFIA
ncbi:hypothetical protein B0H14DRAFT_2591049 [Mycena olivaceomarginata]|nr:hypothetical protein B0H14DRAFT_2591049 [Mycena olivaceomarginata]